MLRSGEARGADVSGVWAQGGIIELQPLGQEGEGSGVDLRFDSTDEAASEIGIVSAEGHGATQQHARGIDGVD